MGLPQRAFRVYEDGRSQTITHFASENVALDLVLAVDISGSMRDVDAEDEDGRQRIPDGRVGRAIA